MQHIELTAKKAVILSVLIFLLSVQCFGEASIDSLEYPNVIAMDGDFRITAFLSGDVCGVQARFYVDNKFINSNALACNRKSTESDQINPASDGFTCGPHVLSVHLLKDDAILANYSETASFGNMPLMTVSDSEGDSREAIIYFKDSATGKPLSYIKTKILNIRKGTKSSEWHTTDSEGRIEYYSRDTGEYKLVISDTEYCGELFFYIKRPLYYDGPSPKEPIIGDLVSMAVPAGVGVKVYDSEGSLYLIASTSITGGVNYTINESGNYTVVIGDENSVYGTANVSLYVSDKAADSLKAEPKKALRGEPVILSLNADGAPLGNATLTIEDPEGMLEDVSTGADGKYSYIPEYAGTYVVSFSDPKHLGAEVRFEARNRFLLDYTPKEPRVDADINVYARDQGNNLVSGATVSVKDVAYGLTGPDGRYTFRVPDGRNYTALVTRPDYWDASIEFTTISTLFIEITPEEFELGGTVHMSAYDNRRKAVDAEFLVTGPDGSQDKSNGSYTPRKTGQYVLSASRAGYIPASGNCSVKQHPLELSIAISRDRVLINTTSRGSPAGNITLVIEKTSGKEKVVTDRNGNAAVRIRNDGRVKISANAAGENPDYGKITVVRNIVKMHDFSGLITSLSAVALVALISIAAVYAAPWGGSSGRKSRNVSSRTQVHGSKPGYSHKHSSLSGHKGGRSGLSRK